MFFNYDDLSAMGELDVEGGRCVHLFLCSYTRLAAFQKSRCSLPVMFFKKTHFTDLKQSRAYSPHLHEVFVGRPDFGEFDAEKLKVFIQAGQKCMKMKDAGCMQL